MTEQELRDTMQTATDLLLIARERVEKEDEREIVLGLLDEAIGLLSQASQEKERAAKG
jgi:cob(I)alamin adenosyltransferase